MPLGRLVSQIVLCQPMQELWQIKDRGMPVFAHTVDVTLLALAKYPDWHERFPGLSLPAIAVASLLHDLNKLSARRSDDASHSLVMRTEPSKAMLEAIDVLEAAQQDSGVSLDPHDVDHVWHIVVSHHGRWGKIQPQTPEALLVHECDFHSATNHRLTPVDASDIMPLLAEGLRWKELASRLGVTTTVVRDRLREACQAERVADPEALLPIWRRRGYVVTGTLQRMRQFEEVREVVREARLAPGNIVAALAKLMADTAAGIEDPGPALIPACGRNCS